MKPWPALLTKLYPLNARSAAIVERPWWTHDEFGWYRRSDGHIDREVRVHNIDRLTPISFPGLRVGQTWAVNVTDANARVFMITEYDATREEPLPRRHILDLPRSICCPWRAGASWVTDAELLDLCKGGYLLADQACPHLAPWAGVATPCETCEGTGMPKPGNAGKPGKDGAWVCCVCSGTGVRA